MCFLIEFNVNVEWCCLSKCWSALKWEHDFIAFSIYYSSYISGWFLLRTGNMESFENKTHHSSDHWIVQMCWCKSTIPIHIEVDNLRQWIYFGETMKHNNNKMIWNVRTRWLCSQVGIRFDCLHKNRHRRAAEWFLNQSD